MSNELAVPENIPAYLVANPQTRAMNSDALAGISTGAPPSIGISGTRFQIKDGNGESQIIKPAELAESEFLSVVVLGAKKSFSKAYYAEAFDPSQTDAKAPDCFSDDAITPSASVANPVCATCAGCPMNAFNSGRNQAGQPTKGKACSDNKILAVLYKSKVYKFKVPPGSLVNWAKYVKTLDDRGVYVGHVVTYIGFDPNAKFTTLSFRVGKFVQQNAIPVLAEMSQSAEVTDITKPTSFAAPSLPAPKVEEKTAVAPKGEMEDDLFAASPAKPEPATSTDETPRRGRPKKDASSEAPAAALTDDEISKALGL